MHGALLLVSLAFAAVDVEAETLDGRRLRGALRQLSAEQVTIDVAGKSEQLATGALRAVSPAAPVEIKPPQGQHVRVELIDGSNLVALDYRAAKGQATLSLAGGESLSLATKAIHAVRFLGPTPPGPDEARQWAELVEAKTAGDLLILRKAAALDSLAGVVRQVDEQGVTFEIDKEPIPVQRAKLAGLVYYHAAGAALPDGFGSAAHVSGSRVQVLRAALAEERLLLTTPAGAQVSWPLGQLARLDFSNTRPFGELEPELVEHTPYVPLPAGVKLAGDAPFRRDRALESEAMTLSGKKFTQGLAVRSRTRLVYRLPGKFSRFTALAGIDDAVRESGHVRLELRGDDRQLFAAAISGADAPRPISVELAGVKRLEILVDFGEGHDVGDHLDLAEAMLLK